MGLSINTNVASLNAQRRMGKTNKAMQKSFERLSSGLRINSAKDDAAGLAISNRMTAQIRGINQSIRNANDGISMVQTADGALDESTSIVQRIRELAVQSANDSNTASDRANLQDEVDQLVSELDRIGNNTTFNNQNILDGSFVGSKIHIGANGNQTINLNLGDARSTSLGASARSTGSAVTVDGDDGFTAANYITLTSATSNNSAVTIRATVAGDDTVSSSNNAESAIAKAAAINDSSEYTGVTATANAAVVTGGTLTGATLDGSNYITINGQDITGFTVQANDADGALVDAINSYTDSTGVIASKNSSNQLVLTGVDGRNINVANTGNGSDLGLTAAVTSGTLTLHSEENFSIGVAGTGAAVSGFSAGVVGKSKSNSLNSVDISSRGGANTAIDLADAALSYLSSKRSEMGAVQNRLESTINNLSATSENLSASRSRIMDADFASETATMTKNQIMQQAGISILAQSNQSTQLALSLLG